MKQERSIDAYIKMFITLKWNNPSQCVCCMCSHNRELWCSFACFYLSHCNACLLRMPFWLKHKIDQFQHWTIVISTGMRYTWPSVFFLFSTMLHYVYFISNAFLSQLSDCRHCPSAAMVRLSTGRQVVLCCNV